MLKVSLPVGDDLLEIHHNMWTNKDEIFWNGELKSRKHRFFTSTHVFRIPSGFRGEDDVFRVKVGMGFNGTTYSVLRNNKVLLGTWNNQLTHTNRAQMPNGVGLDLNTPPPGRQRAQGHVPQPTQSWREEDLIL